MDPKILEYLKAKYNDTANQAPAEYGAEMDDSAVKAAQEQAQNTRDLAMASTLGSDFSAALTGRKNDTSFQDKMYGDADQGVKALLTRRSALDAQNKATESGLKGITDRISVGAEVDDADPQSKASLLARHLAKTQFPEIPPDQLADMSAADIKGYIKTKGSSGGRGRFQTKSVLDPVTGQIKLETFDGETGDFSPTGKLMGHASKLDAATGSIVNAGNPLAPAIPVMMPGGGTLADARTGIEGERTLTKGIATAEAGATKELVNLQAYQEKRGDMEQKFRDLYEKAYKSNDAGVLMGNVSKAKNGLGFSSGENADALMNLTERDIVEELRRVSGLTVTEGERETMRQLSPRINTSKERFDHDLKALMQYVDQLVKERAAAQQGLREARVGGAAPAAGQTAAPTASFPRSVRNPATGAVAQVSSQEEFDEARNEGFTE